MSLIATSELTKRYGTRVVVDRLTFRIAPGRCTALLGPNGAGKTTTLKMLSGLLAPSSGEIRFQEGKERQDLRETIGYLPQYPAFFNWMSGKEFLVMTAKLARLSAKEAAHRADELLERVGLADAAKRKIGGYSGGMKQRLGLAQAVIHRPKLLMLDEPVSALDPQGRREVMDLLNAMKEETTILFSTHVLHDAEEISDAVLIMNEGRIVVEGDMQQLMRQHEKPTLRIKTSGPLPAGWVEELRGRPFVKSVSDSTDQVLLEVHDVAEARRVLLREMADRGIELERFELGRITLEDLFMKAVQG